MCFSAAASFIAASALAAIGGTSIAAAAGKRATLFAAMPLGFAAQQVSEGVVWLTIDAPAYHGLHRAAVFTFLFFALVVWPTWIPVALGRAERDAARRRWLDRLTWVGPCAFSARRRLPDAHPRLVLHLDDQPVARLWRS